MTECILNLFEPLTAGGGGAIIIFIDLVSTNILLAMPGFPLSQKRHADFCFKHSRLFFDKLHIQMIEIIFLKSICRELISPVGLQCRITYHFRLVGVFSLQNCHWPVFTLPCAIYFLTQKLWCITKFHCQLSVIHSYQYGDLELLLLLIVQSFLGKCCLFAEIKKPNLWTLGRHELYIRRYLNRLCHFHWRLNHITTIFFII